MEYHKHDDFVFVLSGLCGIVKVLLSRREGVIPPNLHFKIPNPECLALVEGRIQVVTKPTPLQGQYVGVNSFGIGGTTGHVILAFDEVLQQPIQECNVSLVKKPPSQTQLISKKLQNIKNIPTLILASGRTNEAVEYFLNQARKNLGKNDFVGLLQELSSSRSSKHDYVGFALATSTGEWEVKLGSKKNDLKSIWYVFQGLGGQWIGMINDMIQFSSFKKSIVLSSKFLNKVGVDLQFVFQTQNLACLNKMQNAFVAIIACEIALTDLLDSLGIRPDKFLGHSLGEVTCAYQDGCLTQEQTILVALYRAIGFKKSNLPPGTMASVALTWEDAQKRCPSDIFTAIHNAENNITIGGPQDSIRSFVDVLIKEGLYAKEVKSVPHAFHTPYVQNCEPLMLKMLKEVIAEPKKRSTKWVSTSVPETNWSSLESKYGSAEYLVNNAVSRVYLYEVLRHIPEKSLVIEIGPHCFLQTIIKQTLKDPTSVIGLMYCKYDNSYFMKSLGTIFLAGFSINIKILYQPLKFPVLAKTPSISPLIKWDHSHSWDVPHYKNELSASQGIKFLFNLTADDFFSGHVIQNKIIFPAAGYIYLVWEAFAKLQSQKPENVPIHIENISFRRTTEFRANRNLEFNICISESTGCFEILEGNEIVSDGLIRMANHINEEILSNDGCENIHDILVREDFYKLLHLKGYNYQGLFRGVQNIDIKGRWAELKWNDNWICFLDTMLQIWILDFDAKYKDLIVPLRIEAVTIYPDLFKDSLCANPDIVKVSHCKYMNIIHCSGIQIANLKPTTIPSLLSTPSNTPTITCQRFFPYYENGLTTVTTEEALEIFIGIVVDNVFPIPDEPLIFTELIPSPQLVCLDLKTIICSKFEFVEHRIVQAKKHDGKESLKKSSNCKTFESIEDLNLLPRSHVIWSNEEMEFSACEDLLVDNGFLVLSTCNDELFPKLNIIAKRQTERQNLYLLRKIVLSPKPALTFSIDMPNFDWVDILKQNILSAKNEKRVFVYSKSSNSGIIGFTKCLHKEPGFQHIRCALIYNTDLEISALLCNDITDKDMNFNVFKNNGWGTFLHMDKTNLNSYRISEHVYANIQSIGDLSSLYWVENSNNIYQKETVNVYFSSLNFRDIMFATGKLPKTVFIENNLCDDCILGLEFSGKYNSKRVFGFSLGKCLASTLDHEPTMMWEVPEKWSLEEAATVPLAYITVLYAFVIRGKLKTNEAVLVHSGSGAVGMSAITIALDLNCVVFTTVGSAEKRTFLKNMFPNLQEERILDSKRDGIFKHEILRQTKGKGVNVVLNSLAREQLKASLDCLCEGGRFLEIGKIDAYNNTTVGLQVLSRNVEIHAIHLDKLGTEGTEMALLEKTFQDYLDQGKIKPLPFTCFEHQNLEEAFRYFSRRIHVGKVIVKIRESTGRARISAIPRTFFYPHKTYIIVGGLGGMGLEVITWMIERGARKLFIVSRSGITTSYQDYKVKKWEAMGAEIFLRNTEMSVRACVLDLFMETLTIGPLGGIFNLALVLRDGLFVNQSAKQFEIVSKCKILATRQLDDFARLYGDSLDHFVVFSSITSGIGNAGQSNYGYANSAMERICEQRKLDGFPAMAIQWGPVGDVGSVAKLFAGESVIHGMLGQPISSCITTMDLLLQQNDVVVSSFLLQEESKNLVTTSTKLSLPQIVADILGIPVVSNIDVNMTMNQHGMDSIMAAQIQYAILRKQNEYVPASSYGNLTFKDLVGIN